MEKYLQFFIYIPFLGYLISLLINKKREAIIANIALGTSFIQLVFLIGFSILFKLMFVNLKQKNLENFRISKKIKDEDVDFIGLSSKYSRPEWMIITSLAVPPPAVRPSIRQSDNQIEEVLEKIKAILSI